MSIGSTINNNLAVQGNLDISGGIIYFSQQQLGSQQQFKNIQLDTSNQAYLSFPYYNPVNGYTNAFTPYTTCNNYTPQGLGIIWDYNTSQGEVDLIGYGGAGTNTGGISIYSYNTNVNTDNPIHIADFWPGGSTIYTGLDISGNGNLTVGYNTNNSPSIDLYGTLNLLNIDYNIAKISFGGGNSGALSCNNNTDNNLYMNTGLDISGNLNLVSTGGSGGSITTYNSQYPLTISASNIDISGNLTVGSQLSPSTTNLYGNLNFVNSGGGTIGAATAGLSILGYAGTAVYLPNYSFTGNGIAGYINSIQPNQSGLALGWNGSGGSGETDLISLGGGGAGGISIFSTQTSSTPIGPLYQIANFWPNSSTIYGDFTVIKNYPSGTSVSSGIYNYYFNNTSLISSGNIYVIINVSSGSYGTVFFNVNFPGSGSETITSPFLCAPTGQVQVVPQQNQNNLKIGNPPNMSILSASNYVYISGEVYSNFSSTPTVYITVFGSPPVNVYTSAISP